MRTKELWALGAALALGAFAPDTRACGGCFIPPSADSVVTGHRMAFAVSPDRTVLWDQIQYTGEPTEFAWVLPVAPGAYIEASTDAWFEALDTATVTTVTAPPLQCAQSDSSGGCGLMVTSTDSASSKGGDQFGGPGVTVVHRGTVGPYETVTLSAANGDSLRTWLDGNGYAVPPDIDPVIDTYVAEGADFIALRLQPGRGVDQMTPVRVVTPSGAPILPLRMVAAGTGNFTEIVLYVIAEDRYRLIDLVESQIDMNALTFDLAANDSNYLKLREAALRQSDGYRYLTTYAALQAFSSPPDPGSGFFAGYAASDGSFAENLAALYFRQASINDPLADGAATCNLLAAPVDAGSLVVEGTPAPGEISANSFRCGSPYTDLAAAMIGMHPSQVWLTRLEMNLPREALTMDCNVGAAESQAPVSNQLLATRLANRPAGCREVLFESSVAPAPTRSAEAFGWGVGALAAVALLRRGRARRR